MWLYEHDTGHSMAEQQSEKKKRRPTKNGRTVTGKGRGKSNSKYLPDIHPYVVFELCKEGYTDERTANAMGISTATLHNWKNKYPEFLESIRAGKEVFDTQQVEAALLRAALGFEYEETEITGAIGQDGKPTTGSRVKRIRKQALPKVDAMRLWLTNRDGDRWKNREDVTVNQNMRNVHLDVEMPSNGREVQSDIDEGQADDEG
jgi:hypothetical protein